MTAIAVKPLLAFVPPLAPAASRQPATEPPPWAASSSPDSATSVAATPFPAFVPNSIQNEVRCATRKAQLHRKEVGLMPAVSLIRIAAHVEHLGTRAKIRGVISKGLILQKRKK